MIIKKYNPKAFFDGSMVWTAKTKLMPAAFLFWTRIDVFVVSFAPIYELAKLAYGVFAKWRFSRLAQCKALKH